MSATAACIHPRRDDAIIASVCVCLSTDRMHLKVVEKDFERVAWCGRITLALRKWAFCDINADTDRDVTLSTIT